MSSPQSKLSSEWKMSSPYRIACEPIDWRSLCDEIEVRRRKKHAAVFWCFFAFVLFVLFVTYLLLEARCSV
jgi:hypothetical protein